MDDAKEQISRFITNTVIRLIHLGQPRNVQNLDTPYPSSAAQASSKLTLSDFE